MVLKSLPHVLMLTRSLTPGVIVYHTPRPNPPEQQPTQLGRGLVETTLAVLTVFVTPDTSAMALAQLVLLCPNAGLASSADANSSIREMTVVLMACGFPGGMGFARPDCASLPADRSRSAEVCKEFSMVDITFSGCHSSYPLLTEENQASYYRKS
jgi:hypothetical protein